MLAQPRVLPVVGHMGATETPHTFSLLPAKAFSTDTYHTPLTVFCLTRELRPLDTLARDHAKEQVTPCPAAVLL